jgi:hypothetical protein
VHLFYRGEQGRVRIGDYGVREGQGHVLQQHQWPPGRVNLPKAKERERDRERQRETERERERERELG